MTNQLNPISNSNREAIWQGFLDRFDERLVDELEDVLMEAIHDANIPHIPLVTDEDFTQDHAELIIQATNAEYDYIFSRLIADLVMRKFNNNPLGETR